MRDNSTANIDVRYQNGTNNSTIANIPTQEPYAAIGTVNPSPLYDINQNGTVTYQVLFEVERLAANSVKTTMTLSSGTTTHLTVTGTHTAASAVTTFDSAYIRGGAASTMLIDNAKLEYVTLVDPATVIILR